jgi:hypothetical protein
VRLDIPAFWFPRILNDAGKVSALAVPDGSTAALVFEGIADGRNDRCVSEEHEQKKCHHRQSDGQTDKDRRYAIHRALDQSGEQKTLSRVGFAFVRLFRDTKAPAGWTNVSIPESALWGPSAGWISTLRALNV